MTLHITPIPACPWCRSSKAVYESGHAQFWCKGCDRFFDKGGVDEGGDYSTFNASARLEREERQKAKQQASQKARRR